MIKQVIVCPCNCTESITSFKPNPVIAGYTHWKCNGCGLRFITYRIDGQVVRS